MKHIKNKNTIKTQNRQKQPARFTIKQQQQQQQQQQRQRQQQQQQQQRQTTSIKTWSLTSFVYFVFSEFVFFSVCSGFECLKPCILYAVRLKSLVYKKDQNKLLTVIFGSREKKESKMYERKGGQAHPSLEYIF